MSLPKELLERKRNAFEKWKDNTENFSPHGNYRNSVESFHDGFDACFSILLERGAGEFPEEESLQAWHKTSRLGCNPRCVVGWEDGSHWAWDYRTAEVAAWKAKVDLLEARRYELLDSANQWAARAKELERENAELKDGISDRMQEREEENDDLQAKLAEKDREIEGLEISLGASQATVIKLEAQLGEKTAALELFKHRLTANADGTVLRCTCWRANCLELSLQAGDQVFVLSYAHASEFEALQGGKA